jgi:hypothetical protein
LYGSVAAQVGQYPSVLSLTDMTAERASAENVLSMAKDAFIVMGLGDGWNFIAVRATLLS